MLCSGLGFKSELLGAAVEVQIISGLAATLGCKVGFFPATYLGLPLCLERL